MRPGGRCAEITPTSNGTSNSASAVAASSITDQSLSLPMMTPTRGSLDMFIPSVRPLAVRQPVRGPHGTFPNVGHVRLVFQRTTQCAKDVHVTDLAARSFGLSVEVHPGFGHPREQVMQSLVHAHSGKPRCAKHVRHHRHEI